MGLKIGDVTVTPIIEIDTPTAAHFLLPDATPENLAPHLDWLAPDHVYDDGKLRLRIQALLVESKGQKIIVDTCVGNDKERDMPAWNQLDGPFLKDIKDAGFPREEVDLVVCTHLHIDHVGWNTMKVDGEWVPTFPNATYLFAQKDYDFWSAQTDDPGHVAVFGDSVTPVFEAGLVKLVEMDHSFTPEVRFLPTAGHTPGHCSVAISSGSEEALITGDIMHHPSQLAHPEWCCSFDVDRKQATQTRHDFLDRYCDSGIPVIGTHWGGPPSVKITRKGGCCRIASE